MATLTYHRKSNGVTYVYRQESYWDKNKKRSATSQVCIGKLGENGEIIYNKRFAAPAAMDALERGEQISESIITGQSLVLAKATGELGLERVLRDTLGAKCAGELLSLAWATIALDGRMYHASVWIEQNECPAHTCSLTSQDISRILANISQDDVDGFLAAWMRHRDRGVREQYCFDITSVSSHNRGNPFVEYGHNRDREKLAQINLALLTSVMNRIPAFYELLPGSMSDVKTIAGFIDRMKKLGTNRIRMLLDRGFYSETNIEALLDARIGFYIPIPSNIKIYQELVDKNRDALEMPEYAISIADDGREAVYGMTLLAKIAGKRVWQHIYYDTARRTEHIIAFFSNISKWEAELISGNIDKANVWAYEKYFTVKETPKRGRKVLRKQKAINAYKTDRAGYWLILSNCEKDAASALSAYRDRALVESQFDDMKNDLDMTRLRTHGQDTMRGRLLVQFLALVICAQIRNTLDEAWSRRSDDKENGFSRRYSLSEAMLRLGSYRKTRFSGRYGDVTSTPTKIQRQLFAAFGILQKKT